jgi:hypothetical protein
MDVARDTRFRPNRRRALVSGIAVAVALLTLPACGAPARMQTLDREPDLARIDRGTIPPGFSSPANRELERLRTACTAANRQLGFKGGSAPNGAELHAELVDGQCEWFGVTDSGAPGPPRVIIGLLVSTGGGGVLDQTTAVLKRERSVDGVGDRAVFAPQTRTLYLVDHDRLWYVQLVGTAPAASDPTSLVALGRAVVQSQRAH